MSVFDRIRDTAEDVRDTAGDAIDSVTGGGDDDDSNSGSDNPAREKAEDDADQSLEGGGFSPVDGGSGFATTPDEDGNQDITVSDEPADTSGVDIESGDSTSSSGSSSTGSSSGESSGSSGSSGGSSSSSNEHTATLDSPDDPEPESQTRDAAEGFGDSSQDQPAVIREELDSQGNVIDRQEYSRRWRSPSSSTPDQELDPIDRNASEQVQEQQEARQQQQREIRSAEFQREQAEIREGTTRNRIRRLEQADEDTRYRVSDELAENVRDHRGVDVTVGDDNLVSREMLLDYRRNQANQLDQAQRELDAFSADAGENLDRIQQDIDTPNNDNTTNEIGQEGSAYQRWQEGDQLAADGSMTAPGDTPPEFQDGPERYYAEPDYTVEHRSTNPVSSKRISTHTLEPVKKNWPGCNPRPRTALTFKKTWKK